jgi:RNA polymerase-binding transcription factor DksA
VASKKKNASRSTARSGKGSEKESKKPIKSAGGKTTGKAGAAAKPMPKLIAKKQAPPTAPQLTKLPPPKKVYEMPESIVGPPPPPPKRSKGAPPPVIAKQRPKAKPTRAGEKPKESRKKIDFANARSVAEAAVQAASMQKAPAGFVIINGRRVRVLSMKGIKVVKRKAASKPAPTVDQEPQPLKLGKTKLSPRDLDRYHDILLRLRTELVGRVDDTEREALKSSDGGLSTMPLHMADIGTDTFEQGFALEFAQHDREIVREVDDALARIKDLTYGLCLMTGKPIPKARLDAKPWAKYTVESERIVEKSRGLV